MMLPPRPPQKPIRGLHALIIVFALAAGVGCSSDLEGNGDATTEQRTVPSFERLDVDDGVDVTLTIDPAAIGEVHLTVTTDSNLIEFLTTQVNRSELRVSPDRKGGTSTDLGFEVTGTVATLDSVTANNGASATVTGSVEMATLEADNGASLNGATLEVSSADVDVDNGARIVICATGTVTGAIRNGAELTVRCGGDATFVKVTEGGRVVTEP